MKTNHDSLEMIGRRHIGRGARSLISLAGFHRDVTGMHQEIDLNRTEEEWREELEVQISRIDFAALAIHNGPQGDKK